MHKAHGEACERVPWVGRGETWYILSYSKVSWRSDNGSWMVKLMKTSDLSIH